jgi:DNA polymerase-3 subunit epsilon
MDPSNKFWWFSAASIMVTALVVVGIVAFFWQQLTPVEQTALFDIVTRHFIYIFIVVVMVLAALGFALDGIFHSYILPLNRLPEEIELIHTVNPAHRIKREGSKLIDLLIDAVNEGAERYQSMEENVSQRIFQAKADVEKEKNILAVIMSELPEGVLICNREGQIIFYNRQARKFFTQSEAPPTTPAPNMDSMEGQSGFAFLGLGRSVYEIIDRHLISHALDEITERLAHGKQSSAAYFMLVVGDGRHLQVEAVPVLDPQRQFTGFILIFHDLTSQIETHSRADLLIQSLGAGLRTAVTGVRAAAETMLEFPDLPPEKASKLTRIIYDESLRIARLLNQHTQEGLGRTQTHWPLVEMQAGTMLEKITVKARHLLQVDFVSESYDEDLQLSADSYSFTLAVLFLLHLIHEHYAARRFRCRAHRHNGCVHFDLVWQGQAARMEDLRLWESKILSLPDQGLPLSLGEVLRFHKVEMWPLAHPEAQGDPGIRLNLPAITFSGAAMPRGLAIIPDNRPEFYDFDLFNQPGQIPAVDARLLGELTYTVFDTETTGLDPRGGDEIISIGALRIVNGRILADDRFEQLVNPRRPLRWESIQIHGLRDEMLVDQPYIEEVLPRFHKFAEDTILVAHNAAFDMRMLQLKENVTGVKFINPVLDTMLLSAVVHPAQENHNLLTIAQRLGIVVSGRHTATGDAMATAEMFLKIIPLLAKKGIFTLRQAREASQRTYYARLKY